MIIMSIDKTGPDHLELSVIEGGGDPDADRENRIARARAALKEALGLGGGSDELGGPYGHLAPVPDPSGETGQPAAPEAQGNVTPITEARTYHARQIAGGGSAEDAMAMSGSPVPVSADGEIDARYHRIREARLEVDGSLETMPGPDISQIEDLFK